MSNPPDIYPQLIFPGIAIDWDEYEGLYEVCLQLGVGDPVTATWNVIGIFGNKSEAVAAATLVNDWHNERQPDD